MHGPKNQSLFLCSFLGINYHFPAPLAMDMYASPNPRNSHTIFQLCKAFQYRHNEHLSVFKTSLKGTPNSRLTVLSSARNTIPEWNSGSLIIAVSALSSLFTDANPIPTENNMSWIEFLKAHETISDTTNKLAFFYANLYIMSKGMSINAPQHAYLVLYRPEFLRNHNSGQRKNEDNSVVPRVGSGGIGEKPKALKKLKQSKDITTPNTAASHQHEGGCYIPYIL